jgi:hypothetical protein
MAAFTSLCPPHPAGIPRALPATPTAVGPMSALQRGDVLAKCCRFISRARIASDRSSAARRSVCCPAHRASVHPRHLDRGFRSFLQPLRILNRLCFDAQPVAVRLASKSPMSVRSRSGPEMHFWWRLPQPLQRARAELGEFVRVGDLRRMNGRVYLDRVAALSDPDRVDISRCSCPFAFFVFRMM